MNSGPNSNIQRRMQEVEAVVAGVQQLAGSPAGEQVRRLAGLMMDMHRDGLRRILQRLSQSGPEGRQALHGLADDELVSDLLLLHGLHPVGTEGRVRAAIDKLRPFLKSHDGQVQLVAMEEAAAVVRLEGRCGGCPSVAASLRGMVEKAVLDAAPELSEVRVQTEPCSAAEGR